MEPMAQQFLDELDLAGVYVFGLSIFELLNVFHKWLDRQGLSTQERIAWLKEELRI